MKTSELVSLAAESGLITPAVNVSSFAMMRGVMRGAYDADLPLIVQFSERVARYWGVNTVASWFNEQRRVLGHQFTLHLDHCRDVTLIEKCLEAGWESALFDASDFGFTAAVSASRDISAKAHAFGAEIEGEFSRIPDAQENHGALTGAEEAQEFIQETGIDLFSPHVGTGHGMYEESPVLELKHAETIFKGSGTPLVLHGGSGLEASVLRECFRVGFRKVNVSSELKSVFAHAIEKVDGFGLRSHVTEPLDYERHIEADFRAWARDSKQRFVVGEGPGACSYI